MRDVMEAEVQAWANGMGPRCILNSAETSAGKGTLALRILAHLMIKRRWARKSFIQQYRREHRNALAADAAAAADEADLSSLRIAYVGDTHELVAQHVEKAQRLDLITAHDAGLDRPFSPADATSPLRCSQPEKVKQTRLAGEPVRLVACGSADPQKGPSCIDRIGCRAWQSIDECIHAEFVGMVAERATQYVLPRELHGFDYVLIDEPSDRVFLPERDMGLGLLADHLFQKHPCRDDETGEPDDALTEEARSMYSTMRFVLNDTQNGYWPTEAMAAAGCDPAFFDRFIALTEMRDSKTGMTAATPDDERHEMARASNRGWRPGTRIPRTISRTVPRTNRVIPVV